MSGQDDEAMTDEEIVRDIANALKPWTPQHRQIETGRRAGEIEEKSETEVLAEISSAIHAEIARLRTLVPDFFHREAIKRNRDDARDIIASIDELRAKLSVKIISPELLLRLGLHSSIIGSAEDIKNSPVPRLLDALEAVRAICQAADDNQPNGDQVKLRCAKGAMQLLLKFSDLKENRPSAGSNDSNLCRIAGLLYEAVTEKREQSLRGICQDVLRPYLPLLPS
jgi:hypothetical protein